MTNTLTPYQSAELNSFVQQRCRTTSDSKYEFLGMVRDTVEELQGRIHSLFLQDGKTRALIQDMLPEGASLRDEIGGFKLDSTQLELLPSIVRSESSRDGSGRYHALGSVYDSLEEAQAGVRAECIARHQFPLNLFATFRQEGAVAESPIEQRPATIEQHLTNVYLTPVVDTSTKLSRIWWRVRHRVKRIWRAIKSAQPNP